MRSGLGSGLCAAAPAGRPRGPVSAAPSARQPVDRDPVVCHPDLEELLQAWPAELPDEFFEVTVDDVRRRLAQLKSERWVCHRRFHRLPAPTSSVARLRVRGSGQAPRPPVPSIPMWRGGPQSPGGCVGPLLGLALETPDLHAPTPSPCRKRLEEAPLVTKAFREAQRREKLERYPKAWRRGGGSVWACVLLECGPRPRALGWGPPHFPRGLHSLALWPFCLVVRRKEALMCLYKYARWCSTSPSCRAGRGRQATSRPAVAAAGWPALLPAPAPASSGWVRGTWPSWA